MVHGRRGAAVRGYAADVTRTLPVSGRFTAEQRTIYQLVRDAQAAAERVAGPGAALRRPGAIRRGPSSRAAWPELGLTEGVDATFDPPWADQCRESTGALHPGVPLHGARARPRHRPRGARSAAIPDTAPGVFQRGRRLHDRARHLHQHPAARHPARHAEEPVDDRHTCAPAVERYKDIGVRIEDDYAITETGVEWLSRAPREIAEVEAAMARRGR